MNVPPTPPEKFRVRLSGWRTGFLTISAIEAIHRRTNLGLADAKSCVENCLGGIELLLSANSQEEARMLTEELEKAGAIIHLE